MGIPDEISGEDSLPAILGLVDAFVVAGEGASCLSEACATAKPVWIAAPSQRNPARGRVSELVARSVVRRAETRPLNRRGTTRPQQWLEYFCARLLQSGRVSPVPNLDVLHEDLVERGLARTLGSKDPVVPDRNHGVSDAALRIRSLLGVR